MKKIIAWLTLLLIISIGINGYMFINNDRNKSQTFERKLACAWLLGDVKENYKDEEIERLEVYYSPRNNTCFSALKSKREYEIIDLLNNQSLYYLRRETTKVINKEWVLVDIERFALAGFESMIRYLLEEKPEPEIEPGHIIL